MALLSLPRGRALRAFVLAIAFASVTTAGLVAVPPARAAFTSMVVAPGMYTGTNTYVPGETMTITITASQGDTFNLTFVNYVIGGPSLTFAGQTIGPSGVRVVSWVIPSSWADGNIYRVELRYSGQTTLLATYYFAIQEYTFSAWVGRGAYLPGDTVNVSWSATLVKDGSPAPSGKGSIQVWDQAGTTALSAPHNFSAPQGSFLFVLGTAVPTNQRPRVYAWFNDTSGVRSVESIARFWVYGLGVLVQTDKGTYIPGDVVTVNLYTRASLNPSNPSVSDYAAPGVSVDVNVTNRTSGMPVSAYGKTGLLTDAGGNLQYVFQLASSPSTGSYLIDATATAHGVLTATSLAPFNVQPRPSLTAQVTLDKSQYVSGDTLHASATVSQSSPTNLTYAWQVTDLSSGNILASLAGGNSTYSYSIPTDYQGTLAVTVRVSDGLGHTVVVGATAAVSFGYLSLTLDPTTFAPGDTITASFALLTNPGVVVSPTYYWTVEDASHVTVASGTTTSGSASYVTPKPSSSSYTFTVAASANGRTVEQTATASQVSGYFLSATLDRDAYAPGDVIHISYTITPRGTSALPEAYRFSIVLYGASSGQAMTTSGSGSLSLAIPKDAPTGNLLLFVYESSTGASYYTTVQVGTVNPLMTSLGGIPLYNILLTLLFLVVLIAVILLWRRGGMGRAVGTPPGAAKPAAPPPPAGPAPPSTSPMSVACKHCGTSIEITTSKRPIEVMCPSCGETQVVQ